MPNKSAGYSGTPLSQKLGIGEGTAVAALGAPKHYAKLIAPLPMGARVIMEGVVQDVRPFGKNVSPLIMSFCRFFGLDEEVHPSRLAESNFMKAVTQSPGAKLQRLGHVVRRDRVASG